MKIVLAIDDSPCSSAALEFVRQNHWPKGTRVIVLSAAPIVLAVAYSFARGNGQAVQSELQEGNRRVAQELTARAERVLRDAGLEPQAKVGIGDPREVILRLAEEQNPDLIVMGSHGRSGLKKLLMGSVASHVTAHAPCSVLVVKGSAATRNVAG